MLAPNALGPFPAAQPTGCDFRAGKCRDLAKVNTPAAGQSGAFWTFLRTALSWSLETRLTRYPAMCKQFTWRFQALSVFPRTTSITGRDCSTTHGPSYELGCLQETDA